MHKYFRAIGFPEEFFPSELMTKLSENNFLQGKRSYSEVTDEALGITIIETDIHITQELGVTFIEKKKGDGKELLDNCFPFLESDLISSREETSVESKIDYLASFLGATDDVHFGVTMVYRLRNVVEFLRMYFSSYAPLENVSVSISGLSLSGSVILPIYKTAQERQAKDTADKERIRLMHAAKGGDQNAIRKLSQQEMNTYVSLWQHIQINAEDILTVVESSFIPYGAECELYTVIGDIEAFYDVQNPITDARICIMKIVCNGIPMVIGINCEDLEGEPAVGRRFKGIVWLMGKINFPDTGAGSESPITLTEDSEQ